MSCKRQTEPFLETREEYGAEQCQPLSYFGQMTTSESIHVHWKESGETRTLLCTELCGV